MMRSRSNNVLERGVLAHDADGAGLRPDLDLRIEDARADRSDDESPDVVLVRDVTKAITALRDIMQRLDAGRIEWAHASPRARGLLLDAELAVKVHERARQVWRAGGAE